MNLFIGWSAERIEIFQQRDFSRTIIYYNGVRANIYFFVTVCKRQARGFSFFRNKTEPGFKKPTNIITDAEYLQVNKTDWQTSGVIGNV